MVENLNPSLSSDLKDFGKKLFCEFAKTNFKYKNNYLLNKRLKPLQYFENLTL